MAEEIDAELVAHVARAIAVLKDGDNINVSGGNYGIYQVTLAFAKQHFIHNNITYISSHRSLIVGDSGACLMWEGDIPPPCAT